MAVTVTPQMSATADAADEGVADLREVGARMRDTEQLDAMFGPAGNEEYLRELSRLTEIHRAMCAAAAGIEPVYAINDATNALRRLRDGIGMQALVVYLTRALAETVRFSAGGEI